MQESVRKKWKLTASDWLKCRDEIRKFNSHVNDVNQAERELVEIMHEVAGRTLSHTESRKNV